MRNALAFAVLAAAVPLATACSRDTTCSRADDSPRRAPAPTIQAQPAYAPRPAPAPPAPRRRWPNANSCFGWFGLIGPSDPLPAHGVVIHLWGIGGQAVTTVDRDAKTIQLKLDALDPTTSRKRSRKLTDAQLAPLVALGEAAGAELPPRETVVIPDVREDLYYIDGNDCFVVSGVPIDAGQRPQAARLVNAVYKLADKL